MEGSSPARNIGEFETEGGVLENEKGERRAWGRVGGGRVRGGRDMRAENRWIEEGAFLTVVEGVEDLVALAIIKLFDFCAEDSVGDTGAELDLVVEVGNGNGLVDEKEALENSEGPSPLIGTFEGRN